MLELIAAAIAVLPVGDTSAQAQSGNRDQHPLSTAGSAPEEIRSPAMAGDPLPPRGLDIDTKDFQAPEWEWSLAHRGPTILLGALGGRHSGMPKLAHVGLVWKL